tara:strand:- start:739 stop:1032 length:294 start_codon:yes stop_codon:yes gene_type:complete
MLRKEEKESLAELFLLVTGWPIGLDRFYAGKTFQGLMCAIGWPFCLFMVVLVAPGFSDDVINPIFTVCGIALICGIVLMIGKMFSLIRKFVRAGSEE